MPENATFKHVFKRTPKIKRIEPKAPTTSRRVPVRAGPKIGRNEPCPCGSGQKFKKCCGGIER